MKFRLLALMGCGLLLAACSGNTAESTSSPPPENNAVDPEPKLSEVASKFEQLSKKYDAAMAEFRESYSAADENDRPKIYQDEYPKPADYAVEFMEIAQADPQDPAATDALCWVATRVRGDQGEDAIETLFADHIENVEMKQLCSTLMYGNPLQITEDRLNLLIEKSPHKEVQGLATYSLANYLSRLPRTIQYIEENPRAGAQYGDETLSYLESFEIDDDRVKSLYQSVIENFGDVEIGDRKISTMAESAIFEMENLAIGMVAPDIEAADLDGSDFKLSDYRGKVVVLDFWGDW